MFPRELQKKRSVRLRKRHVVSTPSAKCAKTKPTKIDRIIARVEQLQQELDKVIGAHREIDGSAPLKVDRKTPLDQDEKRLLAGALVEANFNQSEATRILHIGRDRLRYKLAKHGL
jgi:DNA-binding NtrC family response regulator